MSTVTIVANKKTGLMYQPTTNGKWYRVQVKSVGQVERDGFFFTQNQTGFAYFQSEEQCKAFIASATDNKVAGKVVYLDQLTPIVEEKEEYGKQYPYPFRFNGQDLSLEQRLLVQERAIESGLSLSQSSRPIYRKKIYTTDLTRASVILSPDNLDEVQAFIGQVLKAPAVDPKVARLAELQAIPKASRTKEQKAELAELMD